jgi:1-acyl-sn-glycerol-3-phosphate acyltransferase
MSKVGFAGAVKFYIRLGLTVLLCLVMWLIAAIFKLFTGFKPKLQYRVICRMMSIWGHTVSRIWGMRIHVSGPRPKAPFFLVTNHISYTDILLVCAVCPAWFISKAEVASWPGIGPLTRMANTIYINRETRRDVGRMNKLIADLVRDGGGVGFFPEGTTTDGTEVLPFKPSLLQPAVDLEIPVTMAAIAYRTQPGQPPASEHVAWIGDDAFAPHAKQLLSGKTFDVYIRFADETCIGDNRKTLAVRTREVIVKTLAELNHEIDPPPPAS